MRTQKSTSINTPPRAGLSRVWYDHFLLEPGAEPRGVVGSAPCPLVCLEGSKSRSISRLDQTEVVNTNSRILKYNLVYISVAFQFAAIICVLRFPTVQSLLAPLSPQFSLWQLVRLFLANRHQTMKRMKRMKTTSHPKRTTKKRRISRTSRFRQIARAFPL